MLSQLGHAGMLERNIYNLIKFRIEGLTKGMGVEFATKNTRVYSVVPNFPETPMIKKLFRNRKFKKLLFDNILIRKISKESDIATAACYLTSDAASILTGNSIIVDGE